MEEEDGKNYCGGDDKLNSVHGSSRKLSGPTRRSSKANWTEEEDGILRDAVRKYEGKSWKKIAGCLPGRTDVQCLHRWQKVLNPDLVKGPWSKEEDSLLIELVERSGEKKWSEIAEHLPGRMGKQCRERWSNHLKPEINKAAWTEEEERILISAHAEYGNKWSILAKLLPGRTDNSVKNHWNCSLKKRLCSYRGCGFGVNQTPRTTDSFRSLPSSSSKAGDGDPRLNPRFFCSSAPAVTSSDDKRCSDRGTDVCDDNSLGSSYTGLCYEPIQREDLNLFLSTGRFPSTESYVHEPGSRRDTKEPCDSYRRTISLLRTAAMSYRNVPSIIRKRAIQLLHKGVSALDNDGDDRAPAQSCTFFSQSLRSLQPLNLWEREFRDA